jgi:hypothetical protein
LKNVTVRLSLSLSSHSLDFLTCVCSGLRSAGAPPAHTTGIRCNRHHHRLAARPPHTSHTAHTVTHEQRSATQQATKNGSIETIPTPVFAEFQPKQALHPQSYLRDMHWAPLPPCTINKQTFHAANLGSQLSCRYLAALRDASKVAFLYSSRVFCCGLTAVHHIERDVNNRAANKHQVR